MDEVARLDSAGLAGLLRCAQELLEVPSESPEAKDARVATARRLAREMDDCGVDGESLIRYGMAPLFVGPIVASVIATLLLDDEDARKLDFYLDVAGWSRTLGVNVAPRDTDALQGLAKAAAAKVVVWLFNAPFDDIVRLVPPSREQFEAFTVSDAATMRPLLESYQWCVDRLLEADLSEWSTASLHQEYKSAVLGLAAPVPAAASAGVSVDATKLAHEIARRASTGPDQQLAVHHAELHSAMIKQAKMLLCQERPKEAAALFDFLLTQSPGDAAVLNNLGFCLIPIDPDRADEYLRDSLRRGFPNLALHLVNRSWVVSTNAARSDVLQQAERLWVEDLGGAPLAASVWSRHDGEWVPVETLDVRIQLAEAAIRLYLELGELDRAAIWQTRLLEISGAASA